MDIENLRALVYGHNLSVYQKMLARREFEAIEKKALNISDSTISDEFGKIHIAKNGENQCKPCKYKNESQSHPACIRCIKEHKFNEYYR